MQKTKTKIFACLAIFLIVTGLAALFIKFQLLQKFDLKMKDSLYQQTSSKSQDIAIVGIDKKSLDDKEGLGRFQNWRRTYYAKVLDQIEKGNPKLVVFDILFTSKSRGVPEEVARKTNSIATIKSYIEDANNPDDVILSESFSKYKNVLLAMSPSVPDETQKDYLDATAVYEPIQIFKSNVLDIGSVKALPDIDNIVRRVPLGVASHDNSFETLSLLAAEKANGDIEFPSKNGLLINYKLNSENYFDEFSFADVYNEKIDPNAFKDKVVYIGATAQSLQDLQYTPISKSTPMPGVEIQAFATETALNKNFIQEVGNYANLGLSALLSLLVILASLFPNFIFGIAAVVILPILYYFTSRLVFSKGTVLSLVYPILAIIFAFISSLVYRYFAEFKDKLALKNAFSHYVNKSVVDEIMKKPEMLKLGGSKKVITVLFTDIKNFTTYSELLAPEMLTDILNKYFEAMSSVILNNGGTVDKFEGDAIMAFFNAPLDQVNHAELACKSALEMRRALESFNKSLNIGNVEMLDFRVGVCTGPAVVGNLGSKSRFDYTAIGDTVNVASRLESANKQLGSNVLVSEFTYESAKNNYVFREIDSIRVIGKEQPMKVYELLAETSTMSEIGRSVMVKFNAGLALYKKKQFANAKAEFLDLLKIYPEDNTAKAYIQRCEYLMKNMPSQDWDGVWELKTK